MPLPASETEPSSVKVSADAGQDQIFTYYAQNAVKGSGTLQQIHDSSQKGDTYRIVSVELSLTEMDFTPRLDFIVLTSEGSCDWGICDINAIQLIQTDGSTIYAFSGSVTAWLRSPYEIEYVINGDFYTNYLAPVSTITDDRKIDNCVTKTYSIDIPETAIHKTYSYYHDTITLQG